MRLNRTSNHFVKYLAKARAEGRKQKSDTNKHSLCWKLAMEPSSQQPELQRCVCYLPPGAWAQPVPLRKSLWTQLCFRNHELERYPFPECLVSPMFLRREEGKIYLHDEPICNLFPTAAFGGCDSSWRDQPVSQKPFHAFQRPARYFNIPQPPPSGANVHWAGSVCLTCTQARVWAPSCFI